MTLFSKIYNRIKAAFAFVNYKIDIFLFKKNKPVYYKFLILCSSRTGSNMLISYLNSHPNILCYREVFHFDSPKFGFDFERFLNKEKIKKTRNEDQAFFLSKYIYRGYSKTIKSVGFKLIYWQATSKIWNSDLTEIINKMTPDLKIIHLIRKNKLAWLVSNEIAKKTNKWIALDDDSKTPEIQISITPDEFKKNIDDYLYLERTFENLFQGNPQITIYYEDIIANPEIELAKIQEFLQVPVRKLSTKTVKQLSQDASEILSNYSELKSHFQNTEYESYFHV